MLDPIPPPLFLAKAFSRFGCGRIFLVFSCVMRVWLLTVARTCRPGCGLSGAIFFRPVAKADLVDALHLLVIKAFPTK